MFSYVCSDDTFDEKFFNHALENITDIHYSEQKLYDTPKVDKQRITLFIAVGWVILIIALVNYVNLLTTQLLQRIRNINVQMVVGATKKQLFLEFADRH